MIQLKNVSKYYNSNNNVTLGLRKISLNMDIGEFVAITGESGSGKSTFLNVISGLDSYEDGEMFVNGEETSYYSSEDWEKYRRKYISFVFQNYNIIDSYSVLKNIELALIIQGYTSKEIRARALMLIDKVGLTSHINHKASKLSGGQKQRCVIARALAKDCPIILCDEPTGNLDTESSKNVINILKDISKEKLVIIVTHNYEEVKDCATRKIRLFDGEIAEDIVRKETSYSNQEKISTIDEVNYRLSIKSSFKVAYNNLIAVPKKTFFTLLVAIMLVVVVVFMYGSYIMQKYDNNYVDNPSFNNTYSGRIVVSKYDGTEFSETEIDTINSVTCNSLLNHNCVKSIVKNDVVLDSNVLYSDGQGFNATDFLMVPYTVLSSNGLSKGVLPNAINEIVVPDGSNIDLNSEITVTVNMIDYELLVVGLVRTNDSRFIYVDGTFIDMVSENIQNASYEKFISNFQTITQTDLDNEITIVYRSHIGVDDTLPYDTVKLPVGYADAVCESKGDECNSTLFQLDELQVQISVKTGIVLYSKNTLVFENFVEDENLENTIVFNSQMLLDESIWDTTQLSLFVKDSYNTDEIYNKLVDMGYNVVVPSNHRTSSEEAINIFSLVVSIVSSIVIVLIVYFVAYFVLRNVMNSKKKDYLVFRSIGGSKINVYIINVFELFIVMSTSYILIFSLLLINDHVLSKTLITPYLRYFKFMDYIYFYIIVLLFTLMLSARFNRKLFDTSVIKSMKSE